MKWGRILLALALAALCSPAAAATLYITEYANGITPVGSSQPQVPPTPALATQTVALSGSSAASAAFGSTTHVVSLICDEGCSVSFGTSPVATTSLTLLQQGVTYLFGVAPSGKVAAIANSAGNGGGGGGGGNVTIVNPVDANSNVKVSIFDSTGTALTYNANGQATMANSSPVVIASNQSAVPTSNSTQLPAALGQTTMAASLPVAIASNQSAVPTSNSTQLPAALGQTTMSASLPVAIASNQSANALWGQGATGSAVPANGQYVGLSDGTNLRGWLNAANTLNSTGAGVGTANVISQLDDTSPTACTENQFCNTRMSTDRALLVAPYATNANLVSGVTAAMTGTTSTSLIGAPSGSLHNYVTQLTCTNSHATVGTFVLVQDGSGGTTIYEAYAAAVGGGFALTFPAPLRQPTAATALFVQDVTTGSNVICAGSGFSGL